MPQLLTTSATILCPHAGQGTTTPTSTALMVEGGVALAEGDTGVLACPFVPYPCVGYTLRSMGLNATVIEGRKAILTTDVQQSFTGLPLTLVETHLTQDLSTPAPLPAGAASGDIPPELADLSAPVVAAAPPLLAFDSNTMQPATLAVTFTLFAAHPMEWQLRLINPVLPYDQDLTAGLPPGAVVVPSGGEWTTPALTVVLTLSAPFMAALGKTVTSPHSFFLVGISQRGVSAYAEAKLAVS